MAEFLQENYIDESPAYEYINNEIIRKPMPKTHHSRIQLKLATLIESAVLEPTKLIAFTELRCTFDNRSIIPDLVIIDEILPIIENVDLPITPNEIFSWLKIK